MGEGDRGWDQCTALLDLGLAASDVVDVLRAAAQLLDVPGVPDRIETALEALIAHHQEQRLALTDALTRYRATQPQQAASPTKNANPKAAKPTRPQ
jgi:hypothetical protein